MSSHSMGLMMSMHVAKFGGRNNNRNSRVMNYTVIVTFVDIVVILAAFTDSIITVNIFIIAVVNIDCISPTKTLQRLYQSNVDITTTASVQQ